MEKQYPDLVRQIIKDEHTLANHTFSHDPDLYKDPSKLLNEVQKVSQLQEAITGNKARKIFRFPFGSSKASEKCKEIIKKADYNYVDWNVYLQDGSRNPDSEKSYSLAIEGVHNCSETPVILTHMERKEKTGPLQALEPIIKKLLEEGYTFFPINENDHLVHFE